MNNIIKCICGCEVKNIKQHLKSQKHQLLINFIIQPFNNDDE